MKRINFPNVTSFLIGGILIGPWVLGLINKDIFNSILVEVGWISELALGFIAFTIGGSFKISALKKVDKRTTIISILEALGGSIVVILGLFIAYFCGMKSMELTIPMILFMAVLPALPHLLQHCLLLVNIRQKAFYPMFLCQLLHLMMPLL